MAESGCVDTNEDLAVPDGRDWSVSEGVRLVVLTGDQLAPVVPFGRLTWAIYAARMVGSSSGDIMTCSLGLITLVVGVWKSISVVGFLATISE